MDPAVRVFVDGAKACAIGAAVLYVSRPDAAIRTTGTSVDESSQPAASP